MDPAWDDAFRPSKIPTEPGTFGGDGQSSVSVKQSRFGVQGNLPIGENLGPLNFRFEIDFFGQYSKIKDQFYLRKKDFTPEEILTRSFQLGTGYRFWGQMGIRYTFGSIYNNVVNPRMRGGFFD